MTLPNLAKYRDQKQQAVFICSSPKITEEASDYLKSKNQVIYGIGYSDEVLQGIREGKVEGVMAYSMYSFRDLCSEVCCLLHRRKESGSSHKDKMRVDHAGQYKKKV